MNTLNNSDKILVNVEGYSSYMKSTELYKNLHGEKYRSFNDRSESGYTVEIDDQEWLRKKLTAIENTSGALNLDVKIKGTIGIDTHKDQVTDKKNFKYLTTNVNYDYLHMNLERATEKWIGTRSFPEYDGQYGNISGNKMESFFKKINEKLDIDKKEVFLLMMHIIIKTYENLQRKIKEEDIRPIIQDKKTLESLKFEFFKFIDKVNILERDKNNAKISTEESRRLYNELRNLKMKIPDIYQ